MRNYQWELAHGFKHFGGPSMPAGMTAEDRAMLLEKEQEMARVQDEEQREFLALQEEQRLAREESQRLLAQQEEEARLAELERLETEGAEVAESLEEPVDVDTTVADMFAALAFGTEFVGEDETAEVAESTETKRPE